jgi:hypothetical protein
MIRAADQHGFRRPALCDFQELRFILRQKIERPAHRQKRAGMLRQRSIQIDAAEAFGEGTMRRDLFPTFDVVGVTAISDHSEAEALPRHG